MDVKTKICDKKGRKGEASEAGRGKEGFIIKGTTHCGNFPPLRTKGPSIIDVDSFLRFFEPPAPLNRLIYY